MSTPALLAQAVASLQRKSCTVEVVADAAAAQAALARRIPAGARVTRHGSCPVPAPGALNPARAELLAAEYAVTGCTAIAADTGTILLAEDDGYGRTISTMAPVHVCVGRAADVVADVYAGTARCREWALAGSGRPAPRYITMIGGPSRTADIEFVLIQGVHGPKAVHVILVESL